MHYYKRHLGDYAKKAGRLSMLEHGAYTLLIDSCYDRERFPTKEEALRWCWARSAEEIAAVEFVLSQFFIFDGEFYSQPRIQEEIASYHEKANTNKRIAIEREEQRRAKRTRTEHEPCTNEHEPPPNHKPLTTNQEPITNKETIARKARTPSASGIQLLIDSGISEQVAKDYMQTRKDKNAKTLTATALDAIKREADKASYPLENAIRECVARGWVGFKAEWVNKHQPMQNQKDASQAAARATFAKAGMLGGFNNERIINE